MENSFVYHHFVQKVSILGIFRPFEVTFFAIHCLCDTLCLTIFSLFSSNCYLSILGGKIKNIKKNCYLHSL